MRLKGMKAKKKGMVMRARKSRKAKKVVFSGRRQKAEGLTKPNHLECEEPARPARCSVVLKAPMVQRAREQAVAAFWAGVFFLIVQISIRVGMESTYT